MKIQQGKRCPRLLIAAPHSGSGKTMITCGLLQAMTKRQKNIKAYKCGPDYIDPLFHKRVLGIPSKNLDLYFTDEAMTKALFLTDQDRDLAIVEGVMGLYDGLGGTEETASAYHLAKTLQMPILLVVDVHGMGRSVLAEIMGFLSMDEAHLIHGVLLNRCSASFYEKLAPLLEKHLDIPVVGYFPVRKDLQFQSRHLGLQLPDEIEDIKHTLWAIAEQMEASVELDRILQLAEDAPLLSMDEKLYTQMLPKQKSSEMQVKIAVAYDEAFCFYYEDNLRMLEQAGAQLCFFSPLRDACLPKDIQGIVLGGGYPELYAKELADNKPMREEICKGLKSGLPVLAECGGFMYLHDSIETQEKKTYPMVGYLHGTCAYTGHLVRFGYVGIQEKTPLFLPEKTEIRGHEFHYFDSTNNGGACVATKPVDGRQWDCMHTSENQFLGFAHLYYPSNPTFVEHFIGQCKRRKT